MKLTYFKDLRENAANAEKVLFCFLLWNAHEYLTE